MTDLTVETRRIDPVPSLIPYADPGRPLLFLRRSDGIVGLGEALRRVEDVTLLYGLSSIVLAVIFIVVIIVRPSGLLGQREVPLDRMFDRHWWRRRSGPTPDSTPEGDQSP